jgi:hypothetical protein
MTAPQDERAHAPRCGSCGHDLSGTALDVCPECGVPRGGRRFATEPTERLLVLAHALRFMRLAGTTLYWLLVGLLVHFGIGVGLALRRTGDPTSEIPELVQRIIGWGFVVGVAVLCLAFGCFLAIYLAGVWKLTRAGGDDPELDSAAKGLGAAAVGALAVVGTLSVAPASPSLGPWSIALAVLATTILAVHVWALARVRFVCMRRIGAWGSTVARWSGSVLLWSAAGCLCGVVTTGGMLVSPVVVILFLVAVVLDLRLFAPIEAHVAELLNSRTTSP